MSGYTPGPWEADGDRVYFGQAGGISLHNAPDSEANARLISTAPELLKALEWAVRQIDESHIETEAAAKKYDAALAVIARATEAAS